MRTLINYDGSGEQLANVKGYSRLAKGDLPCLQYSDQASISHLLTIVLSMLSAR